MPIGDGFKVCFTNYAYSRIYQNIAFSIEACAKACITPNDCCAASQPGEVDPGQYPNFCSGYICVEPSTAISNIPFVVTAQSHATNDLLDFVNEACSVLSAIDVADNPLNTKTYVLTPTYSARCVCARNHTPGV